MSKQDEAAAELYDHVQIASQLARKANMTLTARAEMLRDLARAYRYVAGGTQPLDLNE